jgi:type I restriction enzyme S subunit
MSVNNEINNLVKLGEYIEETENRNYDLFYGANDVVGMTITKQIIPTKADVESTDLTKFLIVSPREFVYNPRTHGKKIGLGFNNTDKTVMISWNNIAFKVQDSKLDITVIPEYLYLLFSRDEWDREACYRSLGSSTEVFSWAEMCDMKIPLPPIEVQQELVDTYNGLKALAVQNEALIQPLTEACQAYIVDCKKKYPEVELGEYIEELDKRNSDKKIKAVKSVSVTKEFKETGAKVNKDELDGYKLVPPMHLSYVQTTKNEKCFANALNTTNETYVVTQVNKVIRSKGENVLNIGFLHLIFRGVEFDRYAIFNSWGSARETFDWSELCRVRIPLPPPEVQQAIVNLYNCAEEAKKMATEAREKMKMLCPALVQRAINAK